MVKTFFSKTAGTTGSPCAKKLKNKNKNLDPRGIHKACLKMNHKSNYKS